MSTQWPSASKAQPWYRQRIAASSLRPKYSDAPRCGQFSWTSPTRPVVSRNATRSSPSSRTRAGALPGSGISAVRQAGVQYRRSSSPIGVPGPTRHKVSLSSLLSTPFLLAAVVRGVRSVRETERFAERRIAEGGESPPVLARLEDLLRAEDVLVVVRSDGRWLAACGQVSRRAQQDVPHPGDGQVGRPELLLGPVVDRPHRLGHHQVLTHEVGHATERRVPLHLAVDLEVVLHGVEAGGDPVAIARERRRERREREQVGAPEVARLAP